MMCKSDPLIAYGVTKGKRDGRRFRIVMVPYMPQPEPQPMPEPDARAGNTKDRPGMRAVEAWQVEGA